MVRLTLCSFMELRLPPEEAPGRGLHAQVHHGVDGIAGDDPGDHRVADVGTDERDPAEVVPAA